MPDLVPAAPPLADAGPGTTPAPSGYAGQVPEGSVGPDRRSGEPPHEAPPTESPTEPWDSEMGWKTPEDAKRAYKALQADHTRKSQTLSELGDTEALRQERAFIQQLRSDPDFLAWAEKRLQAETIGVENPDADTLEALKIVKRIVDSQMAPLKAEAMRTRFEGITREMDTAHGPEWQTYKPKMVELHQRDMQRGIVSPNAEERFDLDYVQGLYTRAIGADPEYAAKAYGKRLAQKQAQVTTSAPGTAPAAVGTGKMDSFEAAFSAAKRAHGLS